MALFPYASKCSNMIETFFWKTCQPYISINYFWFHRLSLLAKFLRFLKGTCLTRVGLQFKWYLLSFKYQQTHVGLFSVYEKMIKPTRQGAHPRQSVLPTEALSDLHWFKFVFYFFCVREICWSKKLICLCLYFSSCSGRLLIQCKWDFYFSWREPGKIMGWFIPVLDSADKTSLFSALTHDFFDAWLSTPKRGLIRIIGAPKFGPSELAFIFENAIIPNFSMN